MVHSYRYAATILKHGCQPEFQEIIEMLRSLRITVADILSPGGNESRIPKYISAALRSRGCIETRVTADLHVQVHLGKGRRQKTENASVKAKVIDGHLVDYLKGNVAFDLDWNGKDQTFDRDLHAMRSLHETDLIDAGVLLTRDTSLNEVFIDLGYEMDEEGNPRLGKDGRPKTVRSKYGASTTWLGKLLGRIESGRNGS